MASAFGISPEELVCGAAAGIAARAPRTAMPAAQSVEMRVIWSLSYRQPVSKHIRQTSRFDLAPRDLVIVVRAAQCCMARVAVENGEGSAAVAVARLTDRPRINEISTIGIEIEALLRHRVVFSLSPGKCALQVGVAEKREAYLDIPECVLRISQRFEIFIFI